METSSTSQRAWPHCWSTYRSVSNSRSNNVCSSLVTLWFVYHASGLLFECVCLCVCMCVCVCVCVWLCAWCPAGGPDGPEPVKLPAAWRALWCLQSSVDARRGPWEPWLRLPQESVAHYTTPGGSFSHALAWWSGGARDWRKAVDPV